MNKFLLAAAAVSVVGMTITGCSKDEVLSNRKTAESNAIGFHLNGSKAPLSRATPIDDNNLTGNPFDVFAFTTNGGKLFMGIHETLDYGNGTIYDWHDGVTIKWDANTGTAGEWVYKNPDDQAYWPSEALTFYAVYPATEVSNLGWVVKSDKQQIGYNAWGDEFSSDTHKNIDLMYAITPNVTKESCNGTVKMTFKHTLSQVLFQARKELKSMDVNIKSIHIGNVRVGGIFTFPAAGVEPTTAENWDTASEMTDTDKNEFLAHPAKTDAVSLTWDETNDKAKVSMISSTTDVMMPVPQKLVKWSTVVGTPTTITAATAAGQSYLHIKCQIKKNGFYYVGSEGTADANYGDVYVPFEAQWEPGKRYIYTLVFGGGYDVNGNPILDPIKITADQEDWKSPANESDVNM